VLVGTVSSAAWQGSGQLRPDGAYSRRNPRNILKVARIDFEGSYPKCNATDYVKFSCMSRDCGKVRIARRAAVTTTSLLFIIALLTLGIPGLQAQTKSEEPHWNAAQAPIAKNIANLRSLADDVRPRATQLLATQIRALPPSANKVALAYELANLSTEGDQGQETLQAVATTLEEALRQHPVADASGAPANEYVELASLATYEHVRVSVANAQYREAVAKLRLDNARRERINFVLTGLDGQKWTLRDLRGKVVLVNFWATWCPPCRKEMPDLDALYKKYKSQGFVVLAISDEQAATVKAFLVKHKVSYPILLDPGDVVHKRFDVIGIPKSYLYDRDGKLVAQAMDMRTKNQFQGMLAQAGLDSTHKLSKESLLKLPARAKRSL
jgi:thiol-disulfide isomerase/thioredoxin